MRREEVSFLRAHCEMERLRDGQMTMAGRPGPESRLGGETYTLLCLGSGCCAKCTEPRPSPPCIFLARRSSSWPPCSPPHFILFSPSFPPHPPLSRLPPCVDTQPGGDELTQRVRTSLGALSRPLSPCIYFSGALILHAVSFNRRDSKLKVVEHPKKLCLIKDDMGKRDFELTNRGAVLCLCVVFFFGDASPGDPLAVVRANPCRN